MKNITKWSILGLLIVGLVATAFAGKGFGNVEARAALEAGDYPSWRNAMTAQLTEERFKEMQQMHKEREKFREQREAERAVMEAAMEKGYEAWKELVKGSPRGDKLLKVINETNFEKFKEMHQAIKDGKPETAKDIAKELGLGFGKGLSVGKGKQEGNFRGRMPE